MRNQYQADYFVADAKNSGRPLKKDEVLRIANYLSQHGTGLFGMLVCRHGLNAAAT